MAATKNAQYDLREVIGLRPVLGDFPMILSQMAHGHISSALTLEELGFSPEARISRNLRIGLWGRKTITSLNYNNRTLTLEIYRLDEGVFCHLLNKISKWIQEGILDTEDYLGIYDDKTDKLCPTFDSCYEDMVFMESDQLFWALKGYMHAVRGEFV
jgi:hypothetical protein